MAASAARNAGRNAPPARILLLAFLPIGDTLFATPTIRALRARYPHARITALVHDDTAPVMCCVREVDEVVAFPVGADWAGLGPLVRVLRALRAQRFDVAIDFTSPAYKWISFACGIAERTYMKFDPLWWVLPGSHRRWRATHATRHYYDCARELDLPPWDEVSHVPVLTVPASEQAVAQLFLRRHHINRGEQPLIGIHAGGQWMGGLKRWPPERFADLADHLGDRWDARILLLGGPNDAALAATIAGAMRHEPIIATGAVSLLTSLALIEACDLVVGNDSGLLHAAAALGRPFVGIFGPTSPANFRPVATRPRQGALVLPTRPCCTPRYFVGGNPLWYRPCCRGTCRALLTIGVDAVVAQSDLLLWRRCAIRREPASGAEPSAIRHQPSGQAGG